jgi:hypothetical protein
MFFPQAEDRMNRVIISGALILALAGRSAAGDEKSLPKVTGVSKQETARAELTDGTLVVRVNCRGRAGDCELTGEKGRWPERVTLALDGLKELEHFEMSVGRMHIQGSRKRSGEFELYFLGDDRDFNKRSRVGTADVRVEQGKTGIMVVFPGKLFADAEKVTFGWVSWLDR